MSSSRNSPVSYRLKPAGKINWDLYVTVFLPNGYHSLDSIVAPIGLCDEIELIIEPGDGIEVFCDLFPGEQNIVHKAMHAFKKAYPFKSRITANITKNIPNGAGLGGGSSDAASVLLQLNNHFDNPLSFEQLTTLGMSVGADVPNFFQSGWRRMTGIGEIVEPVKGEIRELLLVVPDMPLQTKDVYSKWDSICAPECPPAFDLRMNSPYNSLQAASIALYPQISVIIENLLVCGAKEACMTGSGSVVFGWFENKKKADEAFFCLSKERKVIRTATF